MEPKSIIEYFSVIPDPRVDRQKKHKLIDIIVLSVCGLICDCDTWIEIERFCLHREKDFKRFLELPNGIPSHDTFGRVFSLIDPKHFHEIFMNWVNETFRIEGKEQIAIDGKSIRALSKAGVDGVSIISAWGCESRAVLAQVKATRGTENYGFEDLVKILDLKGGVVSMDAAGCTASLTQIITENGGDYVVAIKGNQKTMLKQLLCEFEDAVAIDSSTIEEKRHGRRERRSCDSISLPVSYEKSANLKNERGHYQDRQHSFEWTKIRSACRVTCERDIKGVTSTETRYFLSSLDSDATRLLGHVRNHWEVENCLHYVLDVAFDEDHARMRDGFALENTALARKMALNLVKTEKSSKDSMRVKRKRASWDFEYLVKILELNVTQEDEI